MDMCLLGDAGDEKLITILVARERISRMTLAIVLRSKDDDAAYAGARVSA